MPFLYKNNDRLVRDAKKIRKLIKDDFKKEIKNQTALNLIANCLGWDSWNSMHTADHKRNNWWHDLRWREKFLYLTTKIPVAIDKVNEREELELTDEQREEVLKLLSLSLTPPANLIEKNKKNGHIGTLFGVLNQDKQPWGYQAFDDSRRREGIFFAYEEQCEVADHLKRFFLPENNFPDCFVSCNAFEAAQLIPCFNELGYKTILLEDRLQLPYTIEHEKLTLLPNFNDDKTDPFGIYSYLKKHIALVHKNEESSDYHQKALAMVDLLMLISTDPNTKNFNGDYLKTPSLEGTLERVNKETDESKKDTIRALVSKIYSGRETFESVEKKVKEQQASIILEQWQYVTMQMSSIVKWVREKYVFGKRSRLNQTLHIEDFEREEERCVYLYTPSLNNGFSETSHSLIMFDMLKLKLENEGESTKGDLWFVSSNRVIDYSKVLNKNDMFDFRQLNRSRINLFIYDDNPRYGAEFDTVVCKKAKNSKHDYEVCDSRKEIFIDANLGAPE